VQGIQDPYGTLEQVYGIARRVPDTRVVELADCGHSPHRDQTEQLLDELAAFMGVGA
jgi:pimeloyl-ACP methyl ester carboxylesterase